MRPRWLWICSRTPTRSKPRGMIKGVRVVKRSLFAREGRCPTRHPIRPTPSHPSTLHFYLAAQFVFCLLRRSVLLHHPSRLCSLFFPFAFSRVFLFSPPPPPPSSVSRHSHHARALLLLLPLSPAGPIFSARSAFRSSRWVRCSLTPFPRVVSHPQSQCRVLPILSSRSGRGKNHRAQLHLERERGHLNTSARNATLAC